ncbi:hypothetical protein CDL12_11800 [Handroanthus impetiginosus]|uniref:Agenet domain-containing protein n=1 Tax=Handroanthus impetiginosus TaxID=429701 RepID=A0A2G9HDE0_9LAMI|nr:hypothetical protein CDL12_11800 [Handroanthus impetiginosus]
MGGAATHPQQLIHHQRRRNHFTKGSLVEVRTKEEDFKGVFFSATVILSKTLSPKKGSRKNLKKLYVEYHDLLAHENGSDRLREYVDVSCVRPSPPFQEVVKGLEPGDVVDAFYKDGWWTGVVSRVVEGGERFVVTFEHPPDELEFGLADLRVHWEWVNGRWVRPGNKSIAGLMFDVGRKVEVSFDGEDRKDAWFPATIDKDVGNGAFLVEYVSENNDHKAQAVKVTVDSLHVRPCPPLLKDKNFVLLEKVDAFFDFGWWSGTITKHLENSRYVVFFKQMKRDKEFHQSELRPHLEWKDGKWFTSSQRQITLREDGSRTLPFLSLLCMWHKLSQEVPVSSSNDGTHGHHTDENSSASTATVLVDNLGDGKDNSDGKLLSSLTSTKGHSDQLNPDNQNSSYVTTSLTKRRQHLSYSRNALSQPLKMLKEGNVLGATEEDTQDKPIKEILSGFVSPVSVNNGANSATQAATGEQPTDNPSWGKRTQRKRRSVDAIRNVSEKINTASSSLMNSSTQLLQLESPEADVGGKEPDAVRNTAEDIQNEHSKEETELPIIIGLPCAGMGVKRVRRSGSKETWNIEKDEKQNLNDSTIQKTQDSKQLEIVEFSQKRKRGRPRKIQTGSIQNPVTGNAQRVAGPHYLNKKDDPHRTSNVNAMGIEAATPNQGKTAFSKDKLTTSRSDSENRQGSTMKRTIAKMDDKQVVRESIRLRENRSLKRGRRPITDSRDASRGKMMDLNSTVDVENVACEALNNGLDDEPLSKWIEEMHSPSVIDGSRLSPVSNVEQCTANVEKQRDVIALEEQSEKQPDSRMHACSSVDNVSIVPSEQQTLPFVKNTVLWKTIESMEVFQRIPQRPHFQPLVHFKESSREGLAIGYMVTFSSLVEKTSKLQLDDPKSITDEILETLADLERHGFDVMVVRDCVSEFLVVKSKQEKLVDETNEINNQILEHNQEKNRIEEEIWKINDEIKKLQGKLLLAESAREKEHVAIESLRAKLKETEENIKNVRLDFGGIASFAS